MLVALFIALLAVSVSAAPQECNSCEECTAMAEGSNINIWMASEITKAIPGDCIAVKGRNVTIDCRGNEVSALYGTAIRVLGDAGEVTIDNCSVWGKSFGIEISENAGDVTIENCRHLFSGSADIKTGRYGSSLKILDNDFGSYSPISLNLSSDAEVDISRNTFSKWNEFEYSINWAISISGNCDPQKVRIMDNDFKVSDCGQLWKRAISVDCGNARDYQVETIRVGSASPESGQKTLKCTETARLDPALKLTFFTKDNMLVASLKSQPYSGGNEELPLSGERITISLGSKGDKNMPVTTSADGTASLFVGEEGVLKSIAAGGATATFGGNSYFSSKTANLEFGDDSSAFLSTSAPECEMIYGNYSSPIKVVFVSLFSGTMEEEKTRFKNSVLHDLIDVEGDGHGLFSTKPFSDNKGLFSLWVYNNRGPSGLGDSGVRQMSEGMRAVYMPSVWNELVGSYFPSIPQEAENYMRKIGCSGDVLVFVLDKDNAASGGTTRISYCGGVLFLWNSLNEKARRTFVHEMGHAFGLADEYTVGLFDIPFGYKGYYKLDSHYANCAGDLTEAKKTWGDLVGVGESSLLVNYYEGCSYVDKNVRPTSDSIMKSSSFKGDWYRGFGPVNERLILMTIANMVKDKGSSASVRGLT